MSKKESNSQNIEVEDTLSREEAAAQCETAAGANVADDAAAADDKMSDGGTRAAHEEPAPDYAAAAAEWQDKYLRLQAEFDNYRKRTLREKMDLVETGGQDIIKAMLPVLDDVNRAYGAMEKSDDVAALREGVRLIRQKFYDALRQKGVSEIEAVGLALDTDLHEAVARIPAGEDKHGVIVDVIQNGYKLGERVLRFAKVVVGE